MPYAKQLVFKLVTSKELTLHSYPDVYEGIGCFLGPLYHIQIDQHVTPKQTPCRPILVHLKEAFQQGIDKMCKVGVLQPVCEANPWINSFVLFEGKDKLENLKLRICLDPTKLNKAIVREPYHFKTPGDIAHLLAHSYIVSVCDCKEGYLNQELDEASSFLTTFNTEFGRLRYTMMPFGATVTEHVFQCKLGQCFGHLRNAIVIADDIMIVGKKPSHSDHHQTLTTLLETARKCNM